MLIFFCPCARRFPSFCSRYFPLLNFNSHVSAVLHCSAMPALVPVQRSIHYLLNLFLFSIFASRKFTFSHSSCRFFRRLLHRLATVRNRERRKSEIGVNKREKLISENFPFSSICISVNLIISAFAVFCARLVAERMSFGDGMHCA